MAPEIFLDTAYAIALSSANDQLHPTALQLADQLITQRTRLVSTRAVLLEIGNALSKRRFRSAGIVVLRSLEADANVEIVPLSSDLFSRAFDLYCERSDKEWGLTDCISFVVMQDRRIHSALTADEHFEQAGFQALLRSAGSP